MKRQIPFWKMSGSGNDFVVIDNRRHIFPKDLTTWAQKLCFRQEGIGADGLLLLEDSKKADFRMIYYNSDGSRASMCGNGARCISYFAQKNGVVRSPFTFETDDGVLEGMVQGDMIQVHMSDAHDYRPNLPLRVCGKTLIVHSLHTGVPHVVIHVQRVDEIDVKELGRALRSHKAFGPKGTNVNFVERLDRSTLKIRTYERGVEDETLACGTGVTASAIIMGLQGLVQIPVQCMVRSGDRLDVRFMPRPQDKKLAATEVFLRGPVRVTFKGKLEI